MHPVCTGQKIGFRPSFTILELLVSIGVLGILSSMVLVAVNPDSQFTSAEDAKRLTRVNALEARARDWQIGQQTTLTDLSDTWVPICALDCDCQGGVSFDPIYDAGYVKVIPVDPMADTCYTGFEAKDAGGFITVRATYYGYNVGDDVNDYIARWEFEEDSGSAVVDSTGSFDGVAQGSPSIVTDTPDTVYPNIRSRIFSSGDYVEVLEGEDSSHEGTTALDFDTGETITLAAWIKPSSYQNYQTIITKGRTTGTYTTNYTLRMGNGSSLQQRLTFYYRNSANNTWHVFVSSDNVLQLNEWQHVAVTYTFGNAGSIQLYYNGSPISGTWASGNGTQAPYVSDEPLWIARNYGGESFSGSIDDVRIYRRAVAANEIQAMATQSTLGAESNFVPTDAPNLALWLDASDQTTLFTDSSCTTTATVGDTIGCWKDKSGNATHMTQSSSADEPTYRGNTLEFHHPAVGQAKSLQNSSFTQSWSDMTFSAYCKSFYDHNGLLIANDAGGEISRDFSILSRGSTQNGDFHVRVGGNLQGLNSNTNFHDGDFHHMVWRFDTTANSDDIWIDGSEVYSTAETDEMTRSDTGLQIGATDSVTYYDHIGSCSEIHLFGESISDNEIIALNNYLQAKYAFEAPAISSFSPADDSTNVDLNPTLTMNFSQAIDIISGNIYIYRSSDNALLETIDVQSGQVTGDDTATVTITPSITLVKDTDYYVLVDDTAFDLQSGNSYPGITSNTTWNFRTATGPFTVTDLSSVTLWLDASDSSTLFYDSTCTTPQTGSGYIGCWQDKSGNSNHATQSISDTEKAYYNDSTGYLEFRGAATNNATGDYYNIPEPDGGVIVAVLNNVSDTAGTDFHSLLGNPTTYYSFITRGGVGYQLSFDGAATDRGRFSVNNGDLTSYATNAGTGDFPGGNLILYAEYEYLDSSTNDWEYLAALDNGSGPRYRANYDLGEFILLNEKPTTDEIDELMMYLADKWSIDITAPTTASLSPTNGQTSVSQDSNLVITFTEAVTPATGNVTIYRTSDATTVETISISSAQVTGGGTDTITINPSVLLEAGEEYNLRIADGALTDANGNAFAGYTADEWSFTVWSPTDLGLDMNLWLDAADVDTIFTDSSCSTLSSASYIGCWQDKSGNGQDAIQSVTADKPSYDSVSNAIHFEGSHNNSTTGEYFNLTSLDGGVIFMVVDNVADGGASDGFHGILGKPNSGSAYYYSFISTRDGTAYTMSFDGTESDQGRLAINGEDVSSYAEDAGSGEFPTEKTLFFAEYQSLDSTTNGWTYLMGINTDGTIKYRANLDLHEMLVFNEKLSSNQRQQIENYLITKWQMGAEDYLARWDLNDGAGTTASASDPDHDGTLYNMEEGDWVATTPDFYESNPYALDFDGSNEYIDIPVLSEMDGESSWSVSLWAAANSFPSCCDAAFSIRNGTSSSNLFLLYPYDTANGNGPRIWHRGTSIININSGAPAADGTFNHFVFVSRSATDHELYVNGELVGTSTTSKSLNTGITNMHIGRWMDSQQYYDGQLDDVRLYNRALEPYEIEVLYNGY